MVQSKSKSNSNSLHPVHRARSPFNVVVSGQMKGGREMIEARLLLVLDGNVLAGHFVAGRAGVDMGREWAKMSGWMQGRKEKEPTGIARVI